MIVLTYRDAGITRAEPIPDDTAAPARARVIAEMFGECMVYGVTSLDKVVHGAAVPHAQIPLDPEVITNPSATHTPFWGGAKCVEATP